MAIRHDKVSIDKWITFIVICMVTMLDFGIIFAFGSMFVDMLEQFDASRSSTAVVQSMLIGVSLSFSIVSGCLISRFGLLKVSFVASILVPFGFCVSFFVTQIHFLYVTISLIAGIGTSTIHLVSIILIERFFPTRLHPICFAIQGISVNLAGVLYPLFIEQLLLRYTIHGTFLILGGLLLNGITAPLMLMYQKEGLKEFDKVKAITALSDGNTKETEKLTKELEIGNADKTYSIDIIEETEKLTEQPEDFNEDKTDNIDRIEEKTYDKGISNGADKLIEGTGEFDGDNTYIDNSVSEEKMCYKRCPFSSLLTAPFVFLLLASAICIPSLNAFLGLTVDIIVWKDFTISQGIFAFVPFNIFSFLSKLLPILTQRIKHVSTFVLPITYCLFGIVSQMVVLMSGNYVGMLAGVSCAGYCLGAVFPAMLIVGVKLVDSEDWPLASGLLMTVIGLMSTILGPVFGSIRDVSGSYKEVMVIILVTQCVGILLYTVAFVARNMARHRTTGISEKLSCFSSVSGDHNSN